MGTTATATAARHDRADASVGRAVLRGAGAVLLLGLLALALAVAVVPRLLGGAALTVLSGSMEPTYSPGDVVVAVPQDSYDVGDVVTFQPVSGDPTLVTHRVVGVRLGSETRYVTRGDANGADDAPIVADQVMGRVVYHVPYVGHLAVAAGPYRGLVVTGAGCLLIGYGAYRAFSAPPVDRRRGTTPTTKEEL